MLIYLLLNLTGLVLSFVYILRLIQGIVARDRRQCILALLIPILFWGFIATLRYLDHLAIEKYQREHGGELPPWLW